MAGLAGVRMDGRGVGERETADTHALASATVSVYSRCPYDPADLRECMPSVSGR